MDRLTYDFQIGGSHCWQVKGADNLECREVCQRQEDRGCTDCPIAKAFDRLSAYEETGLEPEEVKYAYQKGWKGALDEIAYEEQAGTILVDNPLLAKYIELGPVDRLRELAQADREGRVVVFQPGYGVVSIYNPKDEDGLYTMKVTGVIKKEEYEAALRREQDG